MITVKFGFQKETKNFDVYRELDSKGEKFPEEWKDLARHPEQHKVGSIYVRKGVLEEAPSNHIEVTIKRID